jgi:hypothetical protein
VVLWCTGLTVLVVTTPLWGTCIWKVVDTRRSSNYICEFLSRLILHVEQLTATLKDGMVGERSSSEEIAAPEEPSLMPLEEKINVAQKKTTKAE